MKSYWLRLATVLIMVALPLRPQPVEAQRPDSVDARRNMVTRAELQSALDEIERNLNSSAYSSSLKNSKRAEAATIRRRLTEGDLRPGDEINLDILGEPGLTKTYTITPARSIVLPGGAEIPMSGVLRSEVQAYLTKKLAALITEPNVTASASIRLSFSGGVGKPGFYSVPAEMLLSSAIQSIAGGPAPTALYKKSEIKRGDAVVIDGPEFAEALVNGRTLDQLNIQAGDEIYIEVKNPTPVLLRIGAIVTAFAGASYLISLLVKL